jgi:outer membrane protein assembly factor BamB
VRSSLRWIPVGAIALVVLGLLVSLAGIGPVSRIAGELFDTERPLKVAYVDPKYGPTPVFTKIWDMPSYFRVWPDDYLNQPSVHGDVVYVINDNVDAQLTAIDATTHDVVWRVPADTFTQGRMALDDHFVYLEESPSIAAFDRMTGERTWERRGYLLSGVGTISDRLIVIDPEFDEAAQQTEFRRLVGLHPTTGQELWRSEFGRYAGMTEYGGSVLALTDGRLISLSAQTGAIEWHVDLALPGEKWQRRTMALHDDLAVITDGETLVVALDLRSHTERWRVPVGPGNPVPGMTTTSISIEDLVATESAVLFTRETMWDDNSSVPGGIEWQYQQVALDQATGDVLWNSDGGQVYWEPIALGDRVFAVTEQSHALVQIDARTGEERWRISIDDPYHNHSPDFILVDTTIYLTNYDDVWQIRPGS